MHLQRDAYGSFRSCLQCGLIVELPSWQPDSKRLVA